MTALLHARDIQSALELDKPAVAGSFFNAVQNLQIDLNDGANRRHESHYSVPIATLVQRCCHLRYLELFGSHDVGEIVQPLRHLQQESLTPSPLVHTLALRWSQIRLVVDTKLCDYIRAVFPNLDTVDLAACGGGGNPENEWSLWLIESQSEPRKPEQRGRTIRNWLSLRPLGNPTLADILPITPTETHLNSLDIRIDFHPIRRPQRPLLQALQQTVAHRVQRLRVDFVGVAVEDLRPGDTGAQDLLAAISQFVKACSQVRLLVLGDGTRTWFSSAQRAISNGGLMLRELQVESRLPRVTNWMRTLKRDLGGPEYDPSLVALRSIVVRVWVRETGALGQISLLEDGLNSQLRPWCKPRRVQLLLRVDCRQEL